MRQRSEPCTIINEFPLYLLERVCLETLVIEAPSGWGTMADKG